MKYIILVCALLMQMCLGATYSWSIYVQPIKLLTGLQQGPVQIPFTTFYFIFPLTMIFTGTLIQKIGPRVSAIVGGLLFGGGWIVASLGHSHFLFTTLGIGALSGVGAGLAYIVPISVCIRWFPKSKGLVTGIAVAGFGGGAALVSQVGGILMGSFNKSPFETFFIFGIVFMITIICSGTFMRYPELDQSAKKEVSIGLLPISSVLRQPLFRLLYFAMFIGLSAGFAINANLKELFGGSGDIVKIGITGVSLFAIANAAGRIVWGTIFDRITTTTAIRANLTAQAIVLSIAPSVLTSAEGFLTIAFLTGFNYGGVLVIYVSSIARCWGAEKVSQIYGWLFSSNIPASLSPILAGLIFDSFNSFNIILYTLSALLLLTSILADKNTLESASNY